MVGSGSAGSTAAVAAARAGASTLLVERLPFLGGSSTAVLDTFYGFFTPGDRPRKVVGGLADEVVAGLRCLGPVLERPNTYGAGTGITYLAEHLKVVWERLVIGAGARVLLHTVLQDVEAVDGRVVALLLATRSGLARVEADVVVDAGGDADLCHFAGFGYERAGDLEPAQTLTTTFRMVGVDHQRRRTITKDELHALMAQAAESGDFDLPRREGSDHITPTDGVTATIMTRIDAHGRGDRRPLVGLDPWLLSEAEIAGRRQALEYARFLVERVPGYEHAALVSLSTQIGVRETRRVHGDQRLTGPDVLAAEQFDDQIGLCGAPIEDHHAGADTRWQYLPDGAAVGIPYGTLVVSDATNALVAGRCFSATHDAHASVRSMAQCMAMGQAAGTAAALALAHAGSPRDVPVADLGVVFAHEHLVIDGGIAKIINPDISLQDVDAAVAEVTDCRAAGVATMVDTMPCDAGRNVVKLAAISRRTGVHIVAPTGLHHVRYYGERHWSEALGSDELAALFRADIEVGIDELDYGGPVLRRTDHRAGIIKIAGSDGGPSRRDRHVFEAAAIASIGTGAPVITHCEQGTGGIEQVELLTGLGVLPSRLILSHTDRVADPGYHRDLLDTGTGVVYDQGLRTADQTVDLVVRSVQTGHGDQVLLGTDGARRSLWRALGGTPGLAALRTSLGARLEGELGQAACHQLWVVNPSRLLRFVA